MRSLILMAALGFTAVASATDIPGQKTRTWNDNTGTFQAVARLIEVNDATSTARLQLESGKTVDVPLRRLSELDRSLVDTLVEGLQAGARPMKVAGIDWHQSFRSASQEARGKNVPTDDQPILCFRVLGKLNGFM